MKESESKLEKQRKEITVEDDQSFAKATLRSNHTTGDDDLKILGLKWEKRSDTFVFELSQLIDSFHKTAATKRSVLGLIARIFDPVGIISPVTTPLKVFLQKLFRERIGWDETLPKCLSDELTKLNH